MTDDIRIKRVLGGIREDERLLRAYKGDVDPKDASAKKLIADITELGKLVKNGRVESKHIDEARDQMTILFKELNKSLVSVNKQKGGNNDNINGMFSDNVTVPDEYYGTYRRPVYDVTSVNANGVYTYDKQFQTDVQDYIKSINPKIALSELNALQSLVPFMIADPHCRRLSEPVKYGYADLLRFMGWNYDESYISQLPMVNGEANPLYAKIEYVFPDTYGNMMLSTMHNGRDTKIILHQLYAKLNKINADYINNPKKYANKRSKEYAEIINALERIVLRKYDPTYLSRYIKDQERPMHTYKMESFVKDLMLFNSILKRHSGTDPLRHPQEKTTMKIVDKRFKN